MKIIKNPIFIAAVVVILLAGSVTAIFCAPLVEPERAEVATATAPTIVGCWSYEQSDVYLLFEYRADGTFRSLAQPKTLAGHWTRGATRVEGTWRKVGDNKIEYRMTDSTGLFPVIHTSEIRFDDPDRITLPENGWQWRRVDRRL